MGFLSKWKTCVHQRTQSAFKKWNVENQDGGVGRHTAPPRTTRTDRKSNDKKSDTKEIKK